MESIWCIHVGDREGLFLHHKAGQTLPVYTYRCTLVLILIAAFFALCIEFITEQASPILRSTSGRQWPLQPCLLPRRAPLFLQLVRQRRRVVANLNQIYRCWK